MEKDTYIKSRELERTKSKIKAIDIILIALVFLAFLAVSIWATIFLNFGKNIENYKNIISKTQMEVNNLEQKITKLDSDINKYLEILNLMEK
jgi:cell division protein FtsL